jgi:PAS domain S-box-containing protein
MQADEGPEFALRLQEISTLLIQEDNLDGLYNRILDAAVELMCTDVGSMQVFRPERGELQLLVGRGFPPQAAVHWEWVRPDTATSCGMALSTGCRVIVPDIEACDAIAGTADHSFLRLSGIRASQSTPLISRSSRLLGMISTHWRKPYRPTERELQHLDVLARQAADLIERNEAETALRESKEQFRWLASIVEFSDDAIISENLAGVIQSWNRGAERLFGYPAEEAIGKLATVIIPPERLHEQYVIVGRAQHGDHIEHYETVRRRKDGSLVHVSLSVSPMRDANGKVVGASKIMRNISERKEREEREHLLMREVNHRAKNMLSVVDAIARQTASRDDPEHFLDRFSERIQALAANQDLLVKNEWKGVCVEDLVRAQLAPFADLIGSRIAVCGSKLRLNAAAAQSIGLALYELSTNAGKYGALSTDGGRVDVSWDAADHTFTMGWIEREGPLVFAPERRGFGATVMKAMAERSVGGAVDLDYAPSGLVWRLTCPATNVLEPLRT